MIHDSFFYNHRARSINYFICSLFITITSVNMCGWILARVYCAAYCYFCHFQKKFICFWFLCNWHMPKSRPFFRMRCQIIFVKLFFAHQQGNLHLHRTIVNKRISVLFYFWKIIFIFIAYMNVTEKAFLSFHF